MILCPFLSQAAYRLCGEALMGEICACTGCDGRAPKMIGKCGVDARVPRLLPTPFSAIERALSVVSPTPDSVAMDGCLCPCTCAGAAWMHELASRSGIRG